MSWLDSPASDTQIPHRNRLWLYFISGLVIIFLIVPTFIVIPMSFSASQYLEFPPESWDIRWYENYFGSSEWMNATWVSLKAAVITVLITTPIATMAAYGLYVSQLRLSRFIFILLITPMMVPVILIAIGVFFAYTKLKPVSYTHLTLPTKA